MGGGRGSASTCCVNPRGPAGWPHEDRRVLSDEEAARLLEDPREFELTQRESDEAHQRGIRGVPFFVFDDRFAVSGCQPESVFREAIQRTTAG
jgi:predicted DsbA family dithiol-disulfide isomerase